MTSQKYYSSMEHLLKVFDRNSRMMGFDATSKEEYIDWKTNVRKKLKEITGMNSMEYCELKPILLESESLDGYTRDKMLIQTEPDVWMPFYILTPNVLKPNIKTPCVIANHGHYIMGKMGIAESGGSPKLREQILLYNCDYGIKLVKKGYIVFCPDARAFGERREWTKQGDEEDLLLESTCIQLNHMAICLGQSVTGMWTWDLMRLIDYIETRYECSRIGCVGLSGGGLQTLWLAAMDDRINCAIISGYFYGYKDSLLKLSDNCGCNYVPNLWKYIDMGDLGALIAPRPLLIESGTEDTLNGERGLVNVIEQLDITRKAYYLLNCEEKLKHHVFKGGHRWDGQDSYSFIDQNIATQVNLPDKGKEAI